MQQDSCVRLTPSPTLPRKREQTESVALSADYSLHDIPDPFVPAKAGTQYFLDSRWSSPPRKRGRE